MSWASRRRTAYVATIFLILGIAVSIPTAILLHRAPTCFDGIQNQNETDIDKGGPCLALDERLLAPASVLWSRSFLVRPNEKGGGIYTAVAYIENSNKGAGIQQIGYRFGLYDDENVLVSERTGTTYVMPGTITPVFATGLDSGNRSVTHTYFNFTELPAWDRLTNSASVIRVDNMQLTDTLTSPRLSADVENTSVADIVSPSFVAVLFDTAGNAFSASATGLRRLNAGEKQTVVFTWPAPFQTAAGRMDILPLLPPALERRP